MTARLLLEVTLRVLAIWLVFTAVSGLVTLAGCFLTLSITSGAGQPGLTLMAILPSIVSAVCQLLLAVLLMRWAPWIAARFCPSQIQDLPVSLHVGAGDVYRIVCFVLGVYLLVSAAEPTTRLALTGMQGAGWRPQMIADAVHVIVHVVAGIVLVFGAEPIGRRLSSLRYDPDTIPKQRFTLGILLLVFLALAVVLGLIRVATYGVLR